MLSIEQAEREKYERIWSHREYRDNSPGERLLPLFMERFKPGFWVVDVGCGTGRAAQKLQDAGYVVAGLDIARGCLDPNVKIPFFRGCIWDADSLAHVSQRFDYFYCTDVMEHLPPEHIDASFDNIAKLADTGGFFQIALFPDEWFGEVLHLTVESQDWWVKKLTERWKTVTVSQPEKRRIVAVVEH